jgi:uncharacterized membrane protein
MKTLVFLLIIIILGAAIWYYMKGRHASEPVTEQTTITDTLVIVKDSIINANAFDTIPSGFYQGMLPCQNCEGIQRTIMFSDDDHYKMEELDWGKGTMARKTEGTWEKRKERFLLYRNNKVVAQYRLAKDSLINTEYNGARIPDSLSKQYALYKKNPVPENPAWRKRKSEGIDMVGNGSEPFWSVEIDNEKLILFRLASAEKPIIVPIEKPLITKDSTVYSIVTEAGATLKISVSSKFCSDGVSNHLYEYKMTVWYKGQMYKGCAVILDPLRQG